MNTKNDSDLYMQADMALGMFEQNFADSRENLIEYAVKQGYAWALPGFLSRRGWLDDDWNKRLKLIRN